MGEPRWLTPERVASAVLDRFVPGFQAVERHSTTIGRDLAQA
jgi:hypothetical protein